DMRHGRTRPASHHKVRASLLLGAVTAYEHHVATLPVDFSHGLGEALSSQGFATFGPGVTQSVFALSQNLPYSFGVANQTLTDGLSLTLSAGLHIDHGAVREGSFSDYRFARMADSPPDVQVIVMPPTGEPGGAGELGFPAAAAAVANAYARATGTTPTAFPI